MLDATGPLAEFYKSRIPDRYGRERLGKEKTLEFWRAYRDRVVKHYGFDVEQSKQANKVLELFEKRLNAFHREHRPDIEEYFLECERLQNAKQDKMKQVAFVRDWIRSKELELRATSRPWLNALALLNQQLQTRLNELADESQRGRGTCEITDRTAMLEDTVIKYVIVGIGVLLILGLFTRIAATVGILFLLSVISTQPPWVMDANTTYFYYQLVEVLALLVLVAFAAGRFAGLDYVIYGLRLRCCPPKTLEM